MIAASFHLKGGNEITEYWDVDFYLKYDIMGMLRDYFKSHPNNHKVENLISTIKNDPDYNAALSKKAASNNPNTKKNTLWHK